MTRDASALAVHERLEHLVSTMPEPDVEAGWAALVAQLEPPVAPVVPLRRPRPYKAILLAVAAAILIGGSALAMVGHGEAPQLPATPGVGSPGGTVGPHTHPAFSGAPPAQQPTPPERSGSHGGTGHAGDSTPPSGGSGDGSTRTSQPASPPHKDSPDDTDHGTGNDGSHDDNGQGNNTQGQDTQGNSGGSGGGPPGPGGSSGHSGGGGDQGSNGGQGSNGQ
jgi:hypothetical protein